MQAQSLQSCPTPYDPMDCSLSGFSVLGIFQARILEWLPFPPLGDLPEELASPSLTGIAVTAELPCLVLAAATTTKSLQSCPTLCDPIDGSPPGSPVPGILQARTLEWGAISFSNAWKWKVKGKSLSRVWLFETPWIAAYQAPLSMGFSRQEYWSGMPLPSPYELYTTSLNSFISSYSPRVETLGFFT